MKCAIIPRVINKDGKKVFSKLFKDLLNITNNNRELTKDIYARTKNSNITKLFPNLKFDSNNEVTLKSLLQETDLIKFIDVKNIINTIERNIGRIDNKGNLKWQKDTTENFRSLVSKMIDFNTLNNYSDNVVALLDRRVNPITNEKEIIPKIVVKDASSSAEAHKMAYDYNLNNRLRDILSQHNVKVGALTALEEARGINGITDFSRAEDAAQGIMELIRIAQGEVGEQTLPEEFAHFALEALGNNPLVERLIDNIEKNGLDTEILGDSYNDYSEAYQGDTRQLAKEAAGKLVAKELRGEGNPVAPRLPLLKRIINRIKDLFKNFSISDINRARMAAQQNVNEITKGILEGALDSEMRLSNITTSDSYYNLKENLTRDQKIVKKIIEQELRRLDIYSSRKNLTKKQADQERKDLAAQGKIPFKESQELLIGDLEVSLEDNTEIEGIYNYLIQSLDVLEQLETRLNKTIKENASLNHKAKVLRDIRNYIASYQGISKDIKSAILDAKEEGDNRYHKKLEEALNTMNNLIGDLAIQYEKKSIPLFIDFLKPYLGEAIEIPSGKHKGKVMMVEDIIKLMPQDISIFDRYLDSLAESKNLVIKVFDQYNKNAKEKARRSTIERSKELAAAHMKLEQAGIKDFEWMFEKDENGDKTGRYISEIDWEKFNKTRADFFEKLEIRYGKNPVGQEKVLKDQEVKEWYSSNMISENVDGTYKSMPRKDLYTNEDFSKLNKAQKEYYQTVINYKASLDKFLPENYTHLLNAIKIRKDLVERIKSSGNSKEAIGQFVEAIKDGFIKRSDDTELATRATLTDFENKQVQTLPIYYTKLREGESMNDLSTDVTSTMMAYTAMVMDYHEMSKVIDIMEMSKDVLFDQQTQVTDGGKSLVQTIKSLGREVESPSTISTSKTKIAERLQDYFDMQVYNRYMKDEGTIGNTKISKAKLANQINQATALSNLALNALAGVANVVIGRTMMRIESFAGEYFTQKDTIKADSIYAKELPSALGELGNRVKISKLSLWNEYHNTMQDYEGAIRNQNFDRKTWFSRMFSQQSLFFINNSGEHWMQTRTSLAVANNTKVLDKNGKEITLWDAYEVQYIDPNNHSLGAKLVLKEGVTKLDGTAITEKDEIKFSKKVKTINQRMHGIYNKTDKSAIQSLALGRMAMLFRRWMRPGWTRRFQGLTYNMDLEQWTEGYYHSSFRFFKALATDLRHLRLDIATNWDKLTKHEQANVRRVLTEVGHLLAIILANMVLFQGDDDDDERSWASSMAEYQLRRSFTELGVFVPGPQMISEGLKLLQHPAAGINTIDNFLGLIDLANPYNYEFINGDDAVIQAGRFKDKSRAQKAIIVSPLLPMYNTVTKALNPQDLIPFYKQ